MPAKRRRARLRWLAVLAVLLALVTHPVAQAADTWSQIAPEAATGWSGQAASTAKAFMVSAAHPAAAEAGREILRAGGSAADAAVTVQLVLGLVEPQSSGIGGGAFALLWDAKAGQLTTYDGRETAPAAARPDRFIRDGRRLPFREAVLSGLSIGTPGTLRVLEALHKAKGRLPWADVIAPALRLAQEGFRVSPRLHLLLSGSDPETFTPAARAYFFDRSGIARPEGHLLRNPDYAETLRKVATGGADAFYSGDIAASIVEATGTAHGRGGDLTLQDLAGYRVIERAPVCFAYREHRICSMAPPSSGGLALAQTFAMLQPLQLGSGRKAVMNASALHFIAEAEKLAYADRDQYIADPDAVRLPTELLNPAYLARRRGLISPERAMAHPAAGSPGEVGAAATGRDATREIAGTSHFSIIDADRNVIAMTTTIESAFGSRAWAAGFLLNNELTDFSLAPKDRNGVAVANAVGPGKRPRSSMAPTIVFDASGRHPIAALGSVGGSRIPLYVIKTLIALLDWKLDAQEAAALINFGSRGDAFEIEIDRPQAVWHALKLKPLGHRIHADFLTSGTHVILVKPDGTLQGGADPRREGIALGD